MSVINGVNGSNGHSNNGFCKQSSVQSDGSLQWKVGLINSAQKYLTAETFGHKVNASGATLKKKQIWTLEQDANDEVVYLRSHLGCYISTDKYGKVTCEEEEQGPSEKFTVEYHADGRWSFRNVAFSTYLGGSEDSLHCGAKSQGTSEWWTLQLDIHPQVNLKNINRKRYAILKDTELQCSEVIPWGAATLIIMEFTNGQYALKTCDNRYLSRDGSLAIQLTGNSLFRLEIKSGQYSGFALKDCQGKYLTAVGSTATLKCRNTKISKDELFALEDSHPQATLTSLANGKRASIRQGVDVSANQVEEEEEEMPNVNETFQIEFDKPSSKWAIRTVANKYWSLEKSGIQAISSSIKPSCLIDFIWQGDGTVGLKAANGNFIYAKPTGSLTAGSDAITDKEKFMISLVNRPLLVLKGDHGFIGFKTQNSQKPEYVCNKSQYDIVFVEQNNTGAYFFRGINGKYWRIVEDCSIVADSDKPTPFIMEFRGQSTTTIAAPNGMFLKGEQNGTLRFVGTEITNSVLWEY